MLDECYRVMLESVLPAQKTTWLLNYKYCVLMNNYIAHTEG